MMRILLVCAGGISTSFLVQNVKKAMETERVYGEISAKPITQIGEYIEGMDVVLIAPQAQFMKDKVEKICIEKKKPYGVIEQALYGSMNGNDVLRYAMELME